MPLIRVGRSPFIGAVLLLAAALNLYLFIEARVVTQLVLVALFGLCGYLLLTRPYLVIDRNSVHIMSRLGFPLRTLHFASPHDIQVVRYTLWIQTSGGPEKVSGFSANARHWRALAAAIAQAQATAPRAGASA